MSGYYGYLGGAIALTVFAVRYSRGDYPKQLPPEHKEEAAKFQHAILSAQHAAKAEGVTLKSLGQIRMYFDT
uniref:Uncharacterized protein n=1 Tax=Tetranychus urticae TaxID=32264 RepID=T1KBS1_TETUR